MGFGLADETHKAPQTDTANLPALRIIQGMSICVKFPLADTANPRNVIRKMKRLFTRFSGGGVALLAATLLTLCSTVIGAEEPAAEKVVISSVETDRLLEHDGQVITVTGNVLRLGKTENGGITFLNFSTQRGGFVAVVFESDYPSFPDGLDGYVNKSVEITGELRPFQGTTPQIKISSPDQIKIVE